MQPGELCARHYRTGEPVAVQWRDGFVTNVGRATREVASDTWLAPALLEVREIFGTELVADPRFRTMVTNALARIIAKGAKGAVAQTSS